MKATEHGLRVVDLDRLCRQKGIPLTVQRRTVLEVLRDRKDHPTADQIYKAVRERIASISRMTIYRVLDLLCGYGLIARVNRPGTAERFDANIERHHHLICRRCEKIMDLEDLRLNRLPLPRVAGFKISNYSVCFSGICAKCSVKGASR